MEDSPPRFRFVSVTFLLGFGFGSFVGVALALLAIAIVSRNSEPTTTVIAAEEPVVPTVANGVPATPTPDLRPRTKSQLDVRLGPGLAFAIIGTIDRGEALQVTGRDFNSGWISIQFPPGSTGRGWVPIDELDGLEDVESLAVAIPTPLSRTLSNPSAGASAAGSGSAASNVRPLNPAPQARIPTSTPPAEQEEPTPNATATSLASGPSDLVVTRIALTADRHISVTIGNRGPGNIVGQTIFVLVRDLAVRSEQLVTPNTTLHVGGTLTLVTQYLQLDDETDIQASVDPSTSLRDPDRSNNVMSATLRPPATRTPGPQRED